MAKRTTTKRTKAATRNARVAPKQERARLTRERLLDVAGELLGEVGIERISTNLICARAGMTPPALYRYFSDKYAVLEALGRRLMDRQNEALFAWTEAHISGGFEELAAHVADLTRATARVTASEPGALWTLRALRAVPQLAHVRIDSHRFVTDHLVKMYAPLLPKMPKKLLWQRLRMSVEFGFAADEMMIEEDRMKPEDIIRETARLMQWILRDPS
jgi:AcrR family transcriptional regulator